MSEKQLPATMVQPNYGLAMPMTELKSVAQIFVEAGMCEPSTREEQAGITKEKKLAQACVKIQAGHEYGLKPHQSIKGIHLVKGKAVPHYSTLLSLVRRYGYEYSILHRGSDYAEIEFFSDKAKKNSMGVSKFTTEDMVNAGLGGDNWKKYKRTMLFARCVSEGVNSICPEVCDGPAYTPEDFGCVTDDGGEIIEVEEKPAPKSSPKPKTQNQTPATSAEQKPSSPAGTASDSVPTAPIETPAEAPPEVTDVEEITEDATAERPEAKHLHELLAAGTDAGLDEAAITQIVVEVMTEGTEGEQPDYTDADTLMANWTFDQFNAMLEAIKAKKG